MNLVGLTVALNISVWSGRKKSREAEDIVSQHFSASKEAGSFYKKLIKSKALEAIQTIQGAARAAHLNMTQPWDDQGYRYLSPIKALDYMSEMTSHADKFNDAVNDFLNTYQTGVIEAQQRLGSLYNPADYPKLEEIKNKFSFNFHTQPIPTQINNDMLEDAMANTLQEVLDKENERRFSKAKRSIWQTAYTKLSAIRDRLSVDCKFKDVTIEGIVEFAQAAKPMSDIVDETLSDFLSEIEAVYGNVDIDLLRKDATYRRSYAATTSRLMYEAETNG